MAYNEEKRGIIGDIVSAPIDMAKFQFASGWAFWNYRSMAATGGVNYNPLYFGSFIYGKDAGINPFTKIDMNKPMIWQRVKGMMGRGFGFDPAETIGKELGLEGEKLAAFKSSIRGSLKNYYGNMRGASRTPVWFNKSVRQGIGTATGRSETKTILSEIEKLAGKSLDDPRIKRSVFNALHSGLTVSKIGAVATPLVGAWTVGTMASDAIGLWYKGAIGILNFVDSKSRQMKDMEFGGLTAGFYTAAAATERQRAIQEIQRSSLNGRRTMGREASVMAGLI